MVRTGNEDEAVAACSFCLKPHTEVDSLVAGPGVYICDECVRLAGEVIANKPEKADPAAQLPVWEQVSTVDEILGNLPRIAAAADLVDRNLTGWVSRARRLGASWAQIGESLGMARQSAWERFAERQ